MPSEITINCVRELVARKLKIAFVESATAGRFASEFALVESSGEILLGGIVCYNESIKSSIFDIPQQFIDKYTAESAEVTKALAENMTRIFKADVIVAITGLASPGGSETPEKPVGTMFMHILTPQGYVAHRELFEGEPESIILKTIDRTCQLIIDKRPV